MRRESYYWRKKRLAYYEKYGRSAWLLFMKKRRQRNFERSPRGQYIRHKNNAKRRGIVWEFTFDSWFAMWMRDPEKYKKRGNKKGCYQMARIKDSGPYSESNVIIVKLETNSYAALLTYTRSSPNPASQYATEVATII